jgi:hypothetical protein
MRAKMPYRLFKDSEIDPGITRRIGISLWLPEPIRESVKNAIRSIDGCAPLEVYRSTLVGNSEWKKAGGELE